MQDRELYRQILGIESPWKVVRVELRRADGEVHVFLEHDEQVRWPCRQCSAVCALHDHQPERRWRHLDTCQYRTILHARPPRSDCSEHGPRVVRLPWAEASSRFTALFEALAISWLKEASQQGIAELLALSWDEIHGILERAVQRGLERRAAEPIPYLGVDEKSFRKRHRYLTVVNDLNRSRVLFVAEGRRQASLDGFWKTLSAEQLARVEAVAMDMWDPYVASTREHLDESEKKIVYDKYHIAAHLAKAVCGGRRTSVYWPSATTFDRHEVRLAAASGELFRGRLARVPRAARKRLENGAGVGVEGNGDAAVRLSSRIGGASFLRAMARLGESQPADADGHRSADVDGSPRKHTHVSETPHYERGQRGVELKDSMGQGHGARFPQSTELHQRHLLPLWETRSGSFAHLKPGRALGSSCLQRYKDRPSPRKPSAAGLLKRVELQPDRLGHLEAGPDAGSKRSYPRTLRFAH